jgi:hypothetical protein
MSGELEQLTDGDARKLERAIVLQLLRDDRAERWSVSELAVEISDFALGALERALLRLEHAGVVSWVGESVCASRATRYLDRLDLIGI